MTASYLSKDWSELSHAYGSAEDVPKLLADLNSPDEQTRQDAQGELFGNIWHQGTVYPATVKALPILIELFKSPECRDRDWVALLLASIAGGNGYFHVHGKLDRIRAGYEESLRAKGSSIEAEITKEADYLAAIRELALEVLPLLEPYLESPEPFIREAVSGAFCRYAKKFPHYKELLVNHLAVERDEDVRQHMEQDLREIEVP